MVTLPGFVSDKLSSGWFIPKTTSYILKFVFVSPVGFKIWKILNLQDEPLGESEEQYRRDTVVSL